MAGVDILQTRAAWSRSFSDGLALCAILHQHGPKMLSYSTMCLAPPAERLATVFRISRELLGVPELCTVEDFQQNIDPRALIAYVSLLRRALKRVTPENVRRQESIDHVRRLLHTHSHAKMGLTRKKLNTYL